MLALCLAWRRCALGQKFERSSSPLCGADGPGMRSRGAGHRGVWYFKGKRKGPHEPRFYPGAVIKPWRAHNACQGCC